MNNELRIMGIELSITKRAGKTSSFRYLGQDYCLEFSIN